MPDLIIIAGPNGAGKTTFASEYPPITQRGLPFVNADEIARELTRPGVSEAQTDLRSGRAMPERVDALIGAGTDFALETTLASLTYAQKIPLWRQRRYVVSLVYVRLPSVEDSIIRVRRRVEAGGHGIPEEALRRRFEKSIRCFEEIHKPM
ncbi:MAG TPA: AAA family ATPase [Afifellaceae bacterium]|nr:AAA family ATPase [Afifellaceae bacterium]